MWVQRLGNYLVVRFLAIDDQQGIVKQYTKNCLWAVTKNETRLIKVQILKKDMFILTINYFPEFNNNSLFNITSSL